MIDICEVLLAAKKSGASDIYLKPGMVPRFRKCGKISEISYRVVTTDDMLECLLKITSAEQRNMLEEQGECCFPHDEPGAGRYRVTVFKCRGVVSMVFHSILTVSEIEQQMNGYQEQIREFAGMKKGLLLFAGNAGSGRTGSMAAVIHEINQNSPVHIMTMESPVEVLQNAEMAIVSQREYGSDFMDAVSAVEGVWKETVDVLAYDGKLDGKLVSKLCQVSGSGVFVLASVYGTTLSEVIGNIATLYAPDEKDEVRKKLSEVLQAIVFCNLTEGAEGYEQKWEVVSVDAHTKNQIRNCL